MAVRRVIGVRRLSALTRMIMPMIAGPSQDGMLDIV